MVLSFGAWRSPVSAPAWGAGGRRFESARPDTETEKTKIEGRRSKIETVTQTRMPTETRKSKLTKSRVENMDSWALAKPLSCR